MPPLNPEFFRDSEKLGGRELALAEIGASCDAPQALSNFNWNGKLTGSVLGELLRIPSLRYFLSKKKKGESKGETVSTPDSSFSAIGKGRIWGRAGQFAQHGTGYVIIGLSNDNKRVMGATFGLAGPVEERDIKIEVSKLWPAGKADTSLVIRGLDGQSFTFEEGGLWSDLLQDDETAHLFTKQSENRPPTPLLQADYGESGIGRFCVRINCQISKSSTPEKGVFARYALLVLPGTRAELLAKSPLVRKGEWPGIKLSEGEFQLGPAAKAAWGCPLVPLMRPGTRFSQLGSAPRAEKLRGAIGGVLRKAVVPETSRACTTLQTKWDRLIRHPEESGAKQPAITWPAASEPEIERGKGKIK